MAIRLSENFRAVFYAPFYAAHAFGHYEAEGVEVELVTSSAPGEALAALLEGGVDLTWGGPMRVMKHHDEHPVRLHEFLGASDHTHGGRDCFRIRRDVARIGEIWPCLEPPTNGFVR